MNTYIKESIFLTILKDYYKITRIIGG